MRKKIFFIMVMSFFFFNGCSSIMKDTPLICKNNKNKAIVNFVNPWNYLTHIDIWEGERYIGTLEPMSLIQIKVEPGKHIFISHSTNWSYVSGNLVVGKQYFIKTNPLPFGMCILGVAKSDDNRIDQWVEELIPKVIKNKKDREQIEIEQKENIKKAIAKFNEGKITIFATIHPEDGHSNISCPNPKYKKKEPLIQGIK